MLPQNSGPAVLFLVGGVNAQSLDGINRPQQLIVFLQVFVIVAVFVFVIGFLMSSAVTPPSDTASNRYVVEVPPQSPI